MPLKHLVKDKIDTHLLAFEIYFRKGWRAHLFKLDSTDFSLVFTVLMIFQFCFTQIYNPSSLCRKIPVDAPVSERSIGH